MSASDPSAPGLPIAPGGGGVPTTRTVTAGTGLTGGGALSGDITIAASFGTTSGTVTQGNDSRVTGAAQKSANLSDIESASTARTNLGLGSLATASSVASTSISDSTTVGRALVTATDAAAARTTLGLGSLATASSIGSSEIADGSIAVGDLASATVTTLLGLRHLPIGGYVTADATQGTVVGGGAAVDPADYAVSGRTSVYTLSVVGSVVSGQTLTVVLYDLTAALAAATLTWTETSATRKTASVTAPGSAHVYELRVSCSGSTAAHYGVTHTANLRITWS